MEKIERAQSSQRGKIIGPIIRWAANYVRENWDPGS